MSLLKFKNFIFGKKQNDPTPAEVSSQEDNIKLLRKNDEEKEVRGKGWYHPDSDQHVPVEPDSIYHTREVALNPHKFGITDETLHSFYNYRKSQFKPEDDISYIKAYKNADWSDEIVHGMHDRGWLRVNHHKDHKIYYLGGSSANHINTGIKKLIQNKVITHGYRIKAHVYGYGETKGQLFSMNYAEAKKLP